MALATPGCINEKSTGRIYCDDTEIRQIPAKSTDYFTPPTFHAT